MLRGVRWHLCVLRDVPINLRLVAFRPAPAEKGLRRHKQGRVESEKSQATLAKLVQPFACVESGAVQTLAAKELLHCGESPKRGEIGVQVRPILL